ncbi:ATP-binding cassette domain-containing protein [Anaerocolumna sp. MB42-C2]|uniref:ATP-binding cassette domain-containing protein n=1 Tax=Anaerocolumna sp. MB42-C2 TaxID=3070997 RepID=UPI0027E1794A|nr:ATP-binding cassette domain-containing protein [Anaerocolumna sp. MB42-C2]WMJ90484.1 ATP-binding cassette domain-containing protein [Anaerocolumna sp. MB42-C2]
MIKLDKVTKGFGDKVVINNLSIEFYPNKVSAIIAPNGSGKTTLISILSGLMLADKGNINFINPYYQDEVVIILAGEKNLYMKNTVKENLIYFGTIRGLKIGNIQKLIDYYKEFFPLYNDIENQLVEKLSYGQKRLVSIMTAVVSNAKCIIIDEASEGLDMYYVSILKKLLIELKKERIVIITAHDYGFVSDVSDTVMILKDGKIINNCNNISKEALIEIYTENFGLEIER